GGSRAVGVVAGARGRSVHGPLDGKTLPFGLPASMPGGSLSGLRVGDDELVEAELNRYDTVALVGLCHLELLSPDERTGLRKFVESGGKLILRDSNDTAQCPSDDRDYSPLALPLRTTAPPDSNGTARVHL